MAVAASAVLAAGLAARVAIVDWDVHHGNGTQDIFFADGQWTPHDLLLTY